MQESLSGRPVFIDVLVHQEITVRIFCEFPGSGSWVVRVVAPWGKWNTTIWSFLIRKMTTLYFHVLYIYTYIRMFMYIIVLSPLVVLLLLLRKRWFRKKQQQLFLTKSPLFHRPLFIVTGDDNMAQKPKAEKVPRAAEKPHGEKRTKPCTPTTSRKGWKVTWRQRNLLYSVRWLQARHQLLAFPPSGACLLTLPGES